MLWIILYFIIGFISSITFAYFEENETDRETISIALLLFWPLMIAILIILVIAGLPVCIANLLRKLCGKK